ncbi:MAG: conjugal transfer protein TraT [Bacteroidetes bacterium]|nr:conjugal transfer protein TraT [Bacteroidota bacterium]
MEKEMRKIVNLSIMFLVVLGLTSCAGQTLIKKANLDVQTKMSATIFLEPVGQSKRIIYVNVRNTSDKELYIESKIKNTLTSKGYTLTQDPDSANFMLQANVLKVGKSDLRESESALAGGFGGALIGASLAGDSYNSIRNAGLAAGVLGFIADAMVEDTFYSMITDIQVRERPLTGENIIQQQNTNVSQGTGTELTQTTTGGKVNWKIYRSRIISTANKVNLKFDEAQRELENGLIRSISGVF